MGKEGKSTASGLRMYGRKAVWKWGPFWFRSMVAEADARMGYSVGQQVQDHMAVVHLIPVFKQIHALPGSQRKLALVNRN